ncbi:HNH endonuclease signature motif containing protein [Lysinibacillus sphaericus]|uniref:HNH endonuclease signature motif containing protein n=1 Tax=Lysinibacillus sphaericus TaxID=1421 RepID=UPI001FAE7774|nr:HNH endonuclease signature motif containing protein [Lysinibacillus sphaericus]
MSLLRHTWTDEQKEFLRKYYPSNSQRDLLVLFNQHFQLNINMNQLKACLTNHTITSGRTGYFEKGCSPVNKGKKFPGQTNRTSFQKGDTPKNYKPVGTERIDRDGYVLIKVSDSGTWHERWRHKHKVVWEKANGPIPKGHVLIFLDQNKLNISLENLQLITRAQLARMNQYKLFHLNPELTKTGVVIANIYTKMGALNRKEKTK